MYSTKKIAKKNKLHKKREQKYTRWMGDGNNRN